MRCSIVIPTYNKSYALKRVLESIRKQKPPFEYEIVVVNDGSTDDTEKVCEFYSTEYAYVDRPYVCGPAKAKNVGYRMARGDIIFCLNDDIMLMTEDAIERMCDLPPKTYFAAWTYGLDQDGNLTQADMAEQEAALAFRAPFFFMTTVLRRHVYGIGGCEEQFTMLNYEDAFMKDCLVYGRGLEPVWRQEVVGHHIWHDRPAEHWSGARHDEARRLYLDLLDKAMRANRWVASGGPWPYGEN